MLDVGYISIPVFILVMLLEVFINQKESLLLYERNDSLMNLLTGLGMLLFGILLKFVALFFFQWVYQFRIFELENTIWVCIAALFACDLVFYIFHALGHVCRIFWANHIVHHSSKYYNYTVGIRNHFMHLTYRFLFWSPLCLIGFNPFLIIFIDNSTSLYQFLLHTQLIGKLGPLEWILNTPSHHRVHHGSNKQYIDKNFGGLFIIYDKLFGTFCEEQEKPVYGITTEVDNRSPVKIVFQEYTELFREVKKTNAFFPKVKLLFSNPCNSQAEKTNG